MTSKIACVVGARPNFMKMAPILEAFAACDPPIEFDLIHTGQHYDHRMSKVLFEDLGLPEPNLFLGVGSGSHAEQTAKILIAFEKYCLDERPPLVIVVGDVNSTLACSLTAAKLGIPVAHVEAGLRSRDRAMPEEINRIVTDSLSDLLFTTCREADQNLLQEGIHPEKIHFVGNPMIDSLRKHLSKAVPPLALNKHSADGGFGSVTLHRPSNVDEPGMLNKLLDVLRSISRELPLVFPVHPRTLGRFRDLGIDLPEEVPDEGIDLPDSVIRLTPPLGYLEFLYLLKESRVVFTDSGGIQEETTALGVPCLTLRENTERPITIEQGTNHLVGTNPETILSTLHSVLEAPPVADSVPEKWEGGSALEIAAIIQTWLAGDKM